MLLFLATLAHHLMLRTQAEHLVQQPSIFDPLANALANQTFKVAIIGAGIGGASAAYELRSLSDASPPDWRKLDITVFEAESRVGGRIKSVLTYDGTNGAEFAEVGAPYFFEDDECIMNAVKHAGLQDALDNGWYGRRGNGRVGVWDGRQLILRKETDFGATDWKDELKLFFQYGRSPRRMRELAETGRYLLRRFYDRLYYSGGDIRDATRGGDTIGPKRRTAKQTLDLRNVSTAYMADFAEPRARGTQAQDLEDMNDLTLFRSTQPSSKRSVDKFGLTNQSIVERLLLLARVSLRLRSRVGRIDQRGDKYVLSTPASTTAPGLDTDGFDAVIIAAPLQSALLELFGNLPDAENLPNYDERHVTLFTHAEELSPSYFNISLDKKFPNLIYTKNKDRALPFYSIERDVVPVGEQGCLGEVENLFRVVSAQAISDDLIRQLLGAHGSGSLKDAGVQWVHREVWPHAVPKLSAITPPDWIELAPRVHYASAGEAYQSSLENSCRFGTWVGRRVWLPNIEMDF